MSILVTGGNGRLGRALAARLAQDGPVRLAARGELAPLGDMQGFAVGPLDAATDWRAALEGVGCVVHCAALTRLGVGEDERAFALANTDATRALAEQAAEAGARRMVLVSSITVNGKPAPGQVLAPDDAPAPSSAYSLSKLEAERALFDAAEQSGMEAVVVRPPRVLWPELDANLAQLGALVRRGLPLPFGALDRNARGYLSARNLVEGLAAACTAPAAAGRVLLLADSEPLSTVGLLRHIGRKVGRAPRLFPVPAPVLKAIAAAAPQRLLGHLDARAMIAELTGDLRIDSAGSWQALGIAPQPLDARGPAR